MNALTSLLRALEEAEMLGKRGNIVQGYKALEDLKKEGQNYPLHVSFDENVIEGILHSLSETYNQEAVEASLTKTESGFQITEGQTGHVLDVEKSKEAIVNYLTDSWDYGNASINLVVTLDEPRGNAETLSKVKDVLGTARRYQIHSSLGWDVSLEVRFENPEEICFLLVCLLGWFFILFR